MSQSLPIIPIAKPALPTLENTIPGVIEHGNKNRVERMLSDVFWRVTITIGTPKKPRLAQVIEVENSNPTDKISSASVAHSSLDTPTTQLPDDTPMPMPRLDHNNQDHNEPAKKGKYTSSELQDFFATLYLLTKEQAKPMAKKPKGKANNPEHYSIDASYSSSANQNDRSCLLIGNNNCRHNLRDVLRAMHDSAVKDLPSHVNDLFSWLSAEYDAAQTPEEKQALLQLCSSIQAIADDCIRFYANHPSTTIDDGYHNSLVKLAAMTDGMKQHEQLTQTITELCRLWNQAYFKVIKKTQYASLAEWNEALDAFQELESKLSEHLSEFQTVCLNKDNILPNNNKNRPLQGFTFSALEKDIDKLDLTTPNTPLIQLINKFKGNAEEKQAFIDHLLLTYCHAFENDSDGTKNALLFCPKETCSNEQLMHVLTALKHRHGYLPSAVLVSNYLALNPPTNNEILKQVAGLFDANDDNSQATLKAIADAFLHCYVQNNSNLSFDDLLDELGEIATIFPIDTTSCSSNRPYIPADDITSYNLLLKNKPVLSAQNFSDIFNHPSAQAMAFCDVSNYLHRFSEKQQSEIIVSYLSSNDSYQKNDATWLQGLSELGGRLSSADFLAAAKGYFNARYLTTKDASNQKTISNEKEMIQFVNSFKERANILKEDPVFNATSLKYSEEALFDAFILPWVEQKANNATDHSSGTVSIDLKAIQFILDECKTTDILARLSNILNIYYSTAGKETLNLQIDNINTQDDFFATYQMIIDNANAQQTVKSNKLNSQVYSTSFILLSLSSETHNLNLGQCKALLDCQQEGNYKFKLLQKLYYILTNNKTQANNFSNTDSAEQIHNSVKEQISGLKENRDPAAEPIYAFLSNLLDHISPTTRSQQATDVAIAVKEKAKERAEATKDFLGGAIQKVRRRRRRRDSNHESKSPNTKLI